MSRHRRWAFLARSGLISRPSVNVESRNNGWKYLPAFCIGVAAALLTGVLLGASDSGERWVEVVLLMGRAARGSAMGGDVTNFAGAVKEREICWKLLLFYVWLYGLFWKYITFGYNSLMLFKYVSETTVFLPQRWRTIFLPSGLNFCPSQSKSSSESSFCLSVVRLHAAIRQIVFVIARPGQIWMKKSSNAWKPWTRGFVMLSQGL